MEPRGGRWWAPVGVCAGVCVRESVCMSMCLALVPLCKLGIPKGGVFVCGCILMYQM